MNMWFSEQIAHGFSLLAFLSLLSFLGPYAATGRHRALVLALWRAVMVLGGLCLAAACVALAVGQPAHVVRALGVSGGVLTAVFVLFYRMLKNAYQEAELRRIAALDLYG